MCVKTGEIWTEEKEEVELVVCRCVHSLASSMGLFLLDFLILFNLNFPATGYGHVTFNLPQCPSILPNIRVSHFHRNSLYYNTEICDNIY